MKVEMTKCGTIVLTRQVINDCADIMEQLGQADERELIDDLLREGFIVTAATVMAELHKRRGLPHKEQFLSCLI